MDRSEKQKKTSARTRRSATTTRLPIKAQLVGKTIEYVLLIQLNFSVIHSFPPRLFYTYHPPLFSYSMYLYALKISIYLMYVNFYMYVW